VFIAKHPLRALNKRFCKSGGLKRMFFVLKYGQILNCIKYTAMFAISFFVSGRCNLIRLIIQGGGFRFDTEHFYKSF
jgi:hypothetical protein